MNYKLKVARNNVHNVNGLQSAMYSLPTTKDGVKQNKISTVDRHPILYIIHENKATNVMRIR
jgi:hypothetical protein